MKILITGASGFIGSFLCEEGLKRGMETWAGMREHSSRRWLQNEKLNFAFLDMTKPEQLKEQLAKYKEKIGKWNVVIHAAGATKCLHSEDFFKNNFDCTRNLVTALQEMDMMPEQFLYLSSLSVLGPVRENMVNGDDYEEMKNDDTPQPNTAYGESKVKSEQWLLSTFSTFSTDSTFSTFSTNNSKLTIFRPTGVYGPREKDYFIMAKSIKQHVDFAVGYKKQIITFVYVRDLVSAIFAAIGKGDVANGKIYAVSDGRNYSSRAFSDLIQKELGVKNVLHIKAPLWFLKAVCSVSEAFSHLTGKMTALNNDKYNIMKQRNWKCDITPLQHDLGYDPQWQLERGVKECMEWYKNEGWL